MSCGFAIHSAFRSTHGSFSEYVLFLVYCTQCSRNCSLCPIFHSSGICVSGNLCVLCGIVCVISISCPFRVESLSILVYTPVLLAMSIANFLSGHECRNAAAANLFVPADSPDHATDSYAFCWSMSK